MVLHIGAILSLYFVIGSISRLGLIAFFMILFAFGVGLLTTRYPDLDLTVFAIVLRSMLLYTVLPVMETNLKSVRLPLEDRAHHTVRSLSTVTRRRGDNILNMGIERSTGHNNDAVTCSAPSCMYLTWLITGS